MVLVGLRQAGNDTEIRPRSQIPRAHSMSRRQEPNWLNLPRVCVLERRCVELYMDCGYSYPPKQV